LLFDRLNLGFQVSQVFLQFGSLLCLRAVAALESAGSAAATFAAAATATVALVLALTSMMMPVPVSFFAAHSISGVDLRFGHRTTAMRNYVNLAVPTMPLLVADKRGAAETKIIAVSHLLFLWDLDDVAATLSD
jgi:hypothetical protein